MRVRALPQALAGVPVRYSVGFFDVSAAMTDGGFVVGDLAPGEARVFAVRFR